MKKTSYSLCRKNVAFVFVLICSLITASFPGDDKENGGIFRIPSPRRSSLTPLQIADVNGSLIRGDNVRKSPQKPDGLTPFSHLLSGTPSPPRTPPKPMYHAVSRDEKEADEKEADEKDAGEKDAGEKDKNNIKIENNIEINSLTAKNPRSDPQEGLTPFLNITKLDENQQENPSNLFSWNTFYSYSSIGISAVSSIVASISFGLLAYGLGGKYSEALGIIFFIDGLCASALLYHNNQMSLTADDFRMSCNQSAMKNVLAFGIDTLKFVIASVSSLPLGYYIGYSSLSNVSVPFAQLTGVVSFLSLFLLYYKAESRFAETVKTNMQMMSLEGNEKESAYCRRGLLEEVAALNRSEVDEFYTMATKPSCDQNFTDIRAGLKPNRNHDQFWTKELIGMFFGGGFAGVFGGMYLYEIGLSVYELFFQKMIPGLSDSTMISLSCVGAIAIALGPNTLQMERTYHVFKIYTIQLFRWYETYLKRSRDSDIEGGASDALWKRRVTHSQYCQECFTDLLAFILAGGVALTRTALCEKYIHDHSFKTLVTISTTIAYFCIYYSAINSLFDKWSETGRKRNVIAKYIEAEFDTEERDDHL